MKESHNMSLTEAAEVSTSSAKDNVDSKGTFQLYVNETFFFSLKPVTIQKSSQYAGLTPSCFY